MANVWRDYNVVGDLDIYAGGGIGAGGYRSVINATDCGSQPLQATIVFQILLGRLVVVLFITHQITWPLIWAIAFFQSVIQQRLMQLERRTQQIMQLANCC